jgi:hypothetical protein
LSVWIALGLAGCASGHVELAGSSIDRTDRYKAVAGANSAEGATRKAEKLARDQCSTRGEVVALLDVSVVSTVTNTKHARVIFSCRPGTLQPGTGAIPATLPDQQP